VRRGFETPRRAAAHTKMYAQVVREVGRELNVAVVDLWELMGGETEDGKLVGSKEAGRMEVLETWLRDGKYNIKCISLLHR
jgi:hypothetical protein